MKCFQNTVFFPRDVLFLSIRLLAYDWCLFLVIFRLTTTAIHKPRLLHSEYTCTVHNDNLSLNDIV